MRSLDIPKPERFDVEDWSGKLFLLFMILVGAIGFSIIILAML